MEFVAIPSGEIQVEEVRRSISAAISGMQIAKTELTVQQAIDLGVPAARFYFADPNVAAHNLSADDIRTIIKNFREITGRSIRLPTELEWEYAARAGSSEVYPEGQLEKQAYINANSNLRPQPVAQLIPNKWGLYDMLGNVREVVLFGDDNEKYDSLPKLLFMHIPSSEYTEFNPSSPDDKCVGDISIDGVTPTSNKSTLLSSTIKTLDISWTFVGHDHGNDWCCPKDGVNYCFVRHSGYGGYGTWDKGSRIVEISDGGDVKSWVRLESGEIVGSL